MKKQIYIYVCFIIILLCVFPIISFGKNDTEIKISVHEVTVTCDENGSFTVKENNYIGKNSFFVGNDGSITIIAMPNSGYEIDSIDCEPNCETTIDNGKLILTNISDNVVVNIGFRPDKIPSAGIDIEPTVDQDTKKDIDVRHKYSWLHMLDYIGDYYSSYYFIYYI